MSKRNKAASNALKAKKVAAQFREAIRGPSRAPITGRWKKMAEKARVALVRAAEKPTHSTKKGWRIGRSPASKG